MKKAFAILIVAIFLTLPVLAFTQEANLNNVNLEFKGYAEKPVIDGKLDEFGYSKVNITPGDVSYGGNDDNLENLAKAMQYDIYASYDEDYVYMFISMDNKYYTNNGTGAWDQAGVQMGFANVGDDTNVCEFMMGKDSSKGDLMITYFTQYAGAEELVLESGVDFQIVNDGDRVNHEFRVPVTAFYNGGKLKEGAQFTACIVLDQFNEGYMHVQISSGLSNGRNIAQFAKVTLGAPIVKPAATAEVVAPPATPPDGGAAVVAPVTPAVNNAAKTGDAGIITLAAAMIIAAAGIIIFRRKSASK